MIGKMHRVASALLLLTTPFLLPACNPQSRMGMVKEPASGLQFGSVVERNIVTDPSFHQNRRVKLRIRNTSGDQAFDLQGFQRQIEQAYAQAGYQPVSDQTFGLLVDVNLMYSGQVQQTLTREFGFLGAAAGGLAGAARGEAIAAVAGTAAGATLGSILGSYVTDDTYIIVGRVTVGSVRGSRPSEGKRITFSRSIAGTIEDEEEREERRRSRGFDSNVSTGVSVFAGGRNTAQAEIAAEVRSRLARIIRDII